MTKEQMSFLLRVLKEQDGSIRGTLHEVSTGKVDHFLEFQELQEILILSLQEKPPPKDNN